MNLPGTPIATDDQPKILTPRWIDPAAAECALLRPVDSVTGCQLVGRNGSGDYAGIGIPYFLPGETSHREIRLLRDHPDMEYRNGVLREARKYIYPALPSARTNGVER